VRRLVAIIMAVAGGWAPDMGWAETSQLLLHKTLRPDETGFVEGIRNAQLDSEETRQQKKKFNDDQNYNNSGQGVYEDFQQSVTKKWTQKFGKCQTAPFDRRPRNAVWVKRDPNSGVISYQEEVIAADLLKIHQPAGASPSSTSVMTLRITFPGKVKLGTEGQILPDGFTVEWVKSYADAQMGPWKLAASYQLPRPGESPSNLVAQWNLFYPHDTSGRGIDTTLTATVIEWGDKFGPAQVQKLKDVENSLWNVLKEQKVQERHESQSGSDVDTLPSLGIRLSGLLLPKNETLEMGTTEPHFSFHYKIGEVMAGLPAQYAGVKPDSVIVRAEYKEGEDWVKINDPFNYLSVADEKFSKDLPVRLYLLDERAVEFIPPPKLGIQLGELINVMISKRGNMSSGVSVVKLQQVSRARDQGMKEGDVVCAVQDEASKKSWRFLTSPDDFKQTVRHHALRYALSETPLRLLVARDLRGDRQMFDYVQLNIHWGVASFAPKDKR